MKHASFLATFLAGVLVLFYGTSWMPWRLSINRTESLPLGLYLSNTRVGTPQRGDLACFAYHEPLWAKGRYLPDGSQICKEVLGIPGDVVEQQGSQLLLVHGAHRDALGELLPVDSLGRPVPAPRWGSVTIPEGAFYLGSTRVPKSFDSRYLGLIAQRDLTARIRPLLTFDH